MSVITGRGSYVTEHMVICLSVLGPRVLDQFGVFTNGGTSGDVLVVPKVGTSRVEDHPSLSTRTLWVNTFTAFRR